MQSKMWQATFKHFYFHLRLRDTFAIDSGSPTPREKRPRGPPWERSQKLQRLFKGRRESLIPIAEGKVVCGWMQCVEP
ncbi:hypothetical protein CEXT_381871 [Caerostris extrusa]|uniref:Uncharacterized protein n=1 Tax=Caerostris extrusa TaxID=172846 RepID=A0AAV4WGA7_CAEEX|nr:hypothetical protein CEXT_381871 [Caerostris extrusa]